MTRYLDFERGEGIVSEQLMGNKVMLLVKEAAKHPQVVSPWKATVSLIFFLFIKLG